MVLNTVYRHFTSFLGAISHTISGVAVLLAIPTLILLAVFTVPEFIGSLGVNELFNISLTESVTELQAQTPLSPTTLLVALVILILVYMFGSQAGFKLYNMGTPQAKKKSGEPKTRKDYLKTFSNISFLVGGIGGLVLIVVVFEPVTGIPLSLSPGLLTLMAVFTGIYLFAGISARKGWAEGVILGTTVFLLNFVAGLATLNRLALLSGGFGLYYGLRGVRGTSFVLLDFNMEAMTDRVRDRYPKIWEQLPVVSGWSSSTGQEGETDQ